MAQAQNMGEYYQQHAPIARALLNIDSDMEANNLTLCEIEERHGVNLGSGYKNNQACIHSITGI